MTILMLNHRHKIRQTLMKIHTKATIVAIKHTLMTIIQIKYASFMQIRSEFTLLIKFTCYFFLELLRFKCETTILS